MVPNLSQRGPTHDLVVSEGGDIAWAIRKNSPELKSELNAFINEHRDPTSFGATIRWRYFVDKRIVKNALDENEARKFVAVIDLFRRYGAQYNFDYLMIAAQAYQESQLDQSCRGAAGGVGLMQIKPSTAAGKPIGITGVDRDADRNVHAGCAYLRHLADTLRFGSRDRSNDCRFVLLPLRCNSGIPRWGDGVIRAICQD
jgi:membrane-bound lytic murein transglycosylase MltF